MTEHVHDKKTERWYCEVCWEPTAQVIMSNLDEELKDFWKDYNESLITLEDMGLNVDILDEEVEEFLSDGN